MTRKVLYAAGDWFLIPLGGGKSVLGLIARMRPRWGGSLVCYFFENHFEAFPCPEALQSLSSKDAFAVRVVGDMGILSGRWPLRSRGFPWRPDEWPIPLFVDRDVLSSKIFVTVYSDADPSKTSSYSEISESQLNEICQGIAYEDLFGVGGRYGGNGICGYIYVEKILKKILNI